MKTTTKTSVRFTINFMTRSIIGTKASFDKASKGSGPIYEELADKIARHPDFKLVIKEQKVKSSKAKTTYEGLNFAFMESYISIQKNGAQIMLEYKSVKKMAEDSKLSVYPITKKWFLGEFSTEENPFDMEKAKKEISDARIAAAVLGAAIVSKSKDEPQAENEEDTAEQGEEETAEVIDIQETKKGA